MVRETKITQLCRIPRTNDDVFRLDITVHDAVAVEVSDSTRLWISKDMKQQMKKSIAKLTHHLAEVACDGLRAQMLAVDTVVHVAVITELEC